MTSVTPLTTPDALARRKAGSDRTLRAAARFWWIAAAVGQAMFLVYIIGVYAPPVISGQLANWPKMIVGYVAGDTVGNLAVGVHMMVAAIVTFGGALQLVPQIRSRAPAVHRAIGRVFLVAAFIAALGGLWMVWVRGATLSPANTYGVSGNAILILGFGALAWRTAMRRDFVSHQRWAMRTFIVANGVWFLRVGAIGIGAASVPLGLKLDQEAFFDVMVFGSYLIPLAILEIYFAVRASKGAGPRFAMAGGLTLATLVMSVGIVGAWFVLFAPELAKA